MLPTVRMRLERNVEYHESVVEQYKKMMETRQEEQQQDQPEEERHSRRERHHPQQQQQQQEDRRLKEYREISEMHAEAAKQLRDLLNAEALEPAIREVMTQERVMRDRGPVARTLN